MIKQYPLRIDDQIHKRAKAKAALNEITFRRAVEQLLEGWVDGKFSITGGNGNNPGMVRNGKA